MGKPPFHPGDKVKDYTIEKQFSVEGLGAVYTVCEGDMLIKAPFANIPQKALAQFCEEVKALKNLDHPSIVTVIDDDIEAELPWYVIENLYATTLREIIDTSTLPLSTALYYGLWLARAIGHAHCQDPPVWDKSLNPNKIYIKEDRPVIFDFGLSHFGRNTTIALGFQDQQFLYIAPEQLDPRTPPTGSVDIYSLGAILYEMLAGSPPYTSIAEIFDEKRELKTIEALKLADKYPDLEKAELREAINRVYRLSLAKSVSKRYSSIQEMADDIEKALRMIVEIELQRCQENNNIDSAIEILERSIAVGLNEEHQKILDGLRKWRQDQSTEGRENVTFRETLRRVSQMLSQYEKESGAENRQQIHDSLLAFLEVNESPESWQSLILELESLSKLLTDYIAEMQRFTEVEISLEESAETQKISSVVVAKETVVPKIIPMALDTAKVEARAVSEFHSARAEEADEKKKVVAQTAEYVVVVEEKDSSAEKKQRKSRLKIPPGFRWLSDKRILCEKDNSEMIYIPAGAFWMGSNSSHSFDVERPKHQVYLDGFFIDKYSITWRQYTKFCEETGYKLPPAPRWGIYENHPVVNITWFDAKVYCEWAGKYLPTEAQWEKSAGGGIWLDGDDLQQVKNSYPERKYPWGEEPPDDNGEWRANYNEEPTYGRNRGQKSTSSVDTFSKGASPYNVVDMAGNVWEWCYDWYSKDYYQHSPYKNPTGPDEPTIKKVHVKGRERPGRVLRGGSWYIDSRLLRVTARRSRDPEGRGASCGMRSIGLFL